MDYDMMKNHINYFEKIQNGIKEINISCDIYSLMEYFFDYRFAEEELMEIKIKEMYDGDLFNMNEYIKNNKQFYENNYKTENIFNDLPISLEKINIKFTISTMEQINKKEYIYFIINQMFKNLPFGCEININLD